MKKLIAFLALAMMSVASFAKTADTPDKLYKHNGETVDAKIVRVGEYTITYAYVGETAEQVISKYAVNKIVYGSGRTEKVTDKISVSSEDDWENVVVLEDKTQISGLVKKDEIRGKTNAVRMFGTAASNDKKASEKLKKAAAKLGCPFVYITSDKDNQYTAQSIKNGVGYAYK